MREIDKARNYEAIHPGVEIPTEQKAERFDRKVVKEKYRGTTRRKGKATIGTMIVTKLWPGHPDYEG